MFNILKKIRVYPDIYTLIYKKYYLYILEELHQTVPINDNYYITCFFCPFTNKKCIKRYIKTNFGYIYSNSYQ